VGVMYQYGSGVAKDLVEAAKWYRKAVAGGNPSAMVELASFYETGQGVAMDVSESVKWYRSAAKLGNQQARAALRKLGVSEAG